MADVVEILLKLARAAEFVRDADTASRAVKGVGDATEQAGRKAKVNWKSIAKWGGAAAVMYKAQQFVRGAVSATMDLGKTTLMLNRTTGMSVKQSSEWAAMLSVRGQNTRQVSMALTKLGQETERERSNYEKSTAAMGLLRNQYKAVALAGGKDAPKALQKLSIAMQRQRGKIRDSTALLTDMGVRLGDIRRGRAQEIIMAIADRFSKMTNPMRRAALAQKFFGRTGREMLPVLMKGRKGITDNLKMADKYGASLSGKNADSIKEMIAHEREMKMAMLGVKVSLGTALLPAMLGFSKLIITVTRALSPLTRNTKLFQATIILLTAAFLAYRVAALLATVSTWSFNTALLVTLGWVALVIVALVAIGVAAYMVVKHWGAIKKAARIAWEWIKDHWPLLVGILLGPFAYAVIQIAKHWKQIKDGAEAAVTWIKQKFNGLVAFFKALPGRIGNWMKDIPGVGLATKVAGGGVAALGKVGGFLGKHLAAGGSVTSRTAALVGERGAEVMSLPAGATVAPLTRGQTLAVAGAHAGGQTIVTKVYLDRRQIAEAVGTYTADKLARR